MRISELTILLLSAAVLTLACGPSQSDLQARKAAQEKAAFEARLKAAQELSKPPELTGKELRVKGPDGLEYVDIQAGTGRAAVKGGTVTVAFTGWVDGTKIDSSEDRGKPFSYILGSGSVIEGWNLGIEGMREGGVRLLIIPPALAYGKEGRPGFVGRDKTLWYRIELIKAYAPY